MSRYKIKDETGVTLLSAAILRQTYEDYMKFRPITEFCKPRGNSTAGWRRYSVAVKEVKTIKSLLTGGMAALMLTMEPEVFLAFMETQFYDKYCNYYVEMLMNLPPMNAITKERDEVLKKSAEDFRLFYRRWFRLGRALPETDEMILEIMRRCRELQGTV